MDLIKNKQYQYTGPNLQSYPVESPVILTFESQQPFSQHFGNKDQIYLFKDSANHVHFFRGKDYLLSVVKDIENHNAVSENTDF